MTKLVLSELLDSVGINKSILAKLMQVSRQTIHRMGDDVSDDVIAVIDKYKSDMTSDESEYVPVPVKSVKSDQPIPANQWVINHKNIALSRIKYGREDWPIKDVASLFGLSVFAYNAEVQNTINYCVETGTSLHPS